MAQIVDYAVVANEHLNDMIAELKGAMQDEGWQPIGGVTHLMGKYCQSIVKYGDLETDLPKKQLSEE